MGGCVEKEALKFITDKFLNMRAEQVIKAKPLINHESIYDEDCLDPKHVKSGSNEAINASANSPEENCEIYINFVSKQFTLQEIVNNLGGTMKNIQYMKHFLEVEKRKKEQQEKLQQKINSEFAASNEAANFFSALSRRLSVRRPTTKKT
jgi:superoxide dismutase